jgi:hypothetical protein
MATSLGRPNCFHSAMNFPGWIEQPALVERVRRDLVRGLKLEPLLQAICDFLDKAKFKPLAFDDIHLVGNTWCRSRRDSARP